MGTLFQDLRYGLRMLAKNPGFTAVAVVTLALGIGANTAIFSFIDGLLFRPLAFEDLNRLMMVWETDPNGGNRNGVSPADFLDWKNQNEVFENLGAYRWWDVNLTEGGEPERVDGCQASTGFFEALVVKPALGRLFLPEEEQPGKNRVVLLSHGLWQRRFAGDPGIIGRSVRLDAQSHTVVGVLPPNLEWPTGTDLWAPLALTSDEMGQREEHSLYVLARTKPGGSLTRAQAEMSVLARRLEQQYPHTNTGRGVRLTSLMLEDEDIIESFLYVLMGAAGFVLLIACANVANLQLARAIGRQREIALRTALGAGRGRLVRQLLTESVLLSFCGGAVGALLALWGIELIKANIPSVQARHVPGFEQIHLRGSELVFTLVVALAAGIISGLAPVLRSSRLDLNSTLKEGSKTSTRGSRPLRLHGFLVVSEIALALILLVGTTLMVKGFARLLDNQKQDFDSTNLLTLRIAPSQSKYPTPHQRVALYEQLFDRLERLPEVKAGGAVSYLPSSGEWDTESFSIETRETFAPSEMPFADVKSVSANYFRTMHIPLIAGREFTRQDAETRTPVAIISSAMVRRFWPHEDPLGKRIKLGQRKLANPWLTIVGVMGNVKEFMLDREPRATIYIPYLQASNSAMSFVLRDSTHPMSLAAEVRDQIRNLDRDLPVYDFKTMEEVIDDHVAGVRIASALMGSFGVVALFLAAVGIYSLMAYSTSQRTHEMGIRLALGARHGDVLKMVMGQGLALALTGVGVGLIAGHVLMRLFTDFFSVVKPADPVTYLLVGSVLTAVALLACYIPARRATKVDPMVALRHE